MPCNKGLLFSRGFPPCSGTYDYETDWTQEIRHHKEIYSYGECLGGERIFLTSHDKKMVAIVPIEDIEALEKMELAEDIRIAEERLGKIDEEGTISAEEMKKRLGLDVQN